MPWVTCLKRYADEMCGTICGLRSKLSFSVVLCGLTWVGKLSPYVNPLIIQLQTLLRCREIILTPVSLSHKLEGLSDIASMWPRLHHFNPHVASGGNLPLPSDPVFSPLHGAPKLLGFFGTLPWLFLDIYWPQNPKEIFPYCPQNFGGKQRAP